MTELAQDDRDMFYFHESIFSFSEAEEVLGLSDEYNCDKKYPFSTNTLSDDLADYMYDQAENSGCKMDGYAHFTQSDPRPLNAQVDWVLLLQLDTNEDLMWGDCGVGNWFIRREDLKAKNFDNILFNWDCC